MANSHNRRQTPLAPPHVILDVRAEAYRQAGKVPATLIAILFGLTLFTCPAASGGESLEGLAIHSINVTGSTTISKGSILDLMTLRGTSAFSRKILRRKAMPFSNEDAREDLRGIVDLYQRQGFLYATAVLADTVVNRDDGTLSFTINIEEGPPALVREVTFTRADTNDGESRQTTPVLEKLMPDLVVKSGERFRDADVVVDQITLTNAHRNAGYAYFRCEPHIKVDTGSLRVDIEWMMNYGRPCRFDAITIIDNKRISEDLILKQVTFTVGDSFSPDDLDDFRDRIYGLGLFRRVTVDALLSPSMESAVPVRVVVKEAPQVSARLGIGAGRYEHVRALAEMEWRGFTGGARRLNAAVRRSRLEPYNIQLTVTEPYLFSHRISAQVQTRGRLESEPGYRVRRFGLDNSYFIRLHDNLTTSLGYNIERVDRLDDGGIAEEYAAVDVDSSYNTSGPWLGLTFDNSAPLFKPVHGVVLAASYKLAGLLLPNNDFSFTRLNLEARHYRSLFAAVLAVRLKLGRIVSWDDHGAVPIEERFFAGGSGSVRGWGRQELGPKDATGKPVGGKSLLEGSTELRITLVSELRPLGSIMGVLFLDFGNVWVDEDAYRLDQLRYAAGFGIGVDSPVGPVCIDLARPIDASYARWQWDFSIGYAF